MSLSEKIDFYTDGACSGNPGTGAWAWVLQSQSQYKGKTGINPDTTNNQMEMQAMIEALKFIAQSKLDLHKYQITIFTDSKYVFDGIHTWMPNWKKKAWKTAANHAVKNKDLWLELDKLVSTLIPLKIEWVKGHSNNQGNNIADMLATCSIRNPMHIECSCNQYLAGSV